MSYDSMISQGKSKECWVCEKIKGLKLPWIESVSPLFVWCPERESNSHSRMDRGILSPLRLPVPPSGQNIKYEY